jgi:glycosyltransferase involved in cell wall biosynthesis
VSEAAGRPRVAVVSTAQEVAGAEVYLMGLAEEVAARVPLRVLLPERAPGELLQALAAAGAETRMVRGLARRPTPGAVARLVRALRSVRPSVVHANLSDQGDGLATLAAARIAGVPATATLHLVMPRARAWFDRFSVAGLGATECVIAVSESVAGWLAVAGVPHTVVPNGVDTPPAHPGARAELGMAAGDFVVGGIGRLDRQKGWDVLCEAAPLIRRELPDARFVVIGEGPERDRLDRLGQAAGVSFPGYLERAARYAAGFDVMVIPSRYEGFGLVAVEAMLVGVPVAASAVGGLPEVVGDAGELVPPGDAAALAAAVVRLARPGKDVVERARRRAAERFGRSRMAEETLSVWRTASGAQLPSLRCRP